MTSSPAPRMVPSSSSSSSSAGGGGVVRPVISGGPADAVTLRELIATEGALPAEAVLECLQRVAERLSKSRCHVPLDPSRIFIDEDGEIWLGTEAVDGEPPEGDGVPSGQIREELARLLVYLATGDEQCFSGDSHPRDVSLAAPLSIFAERLWLLEEGDSWTYEAIAAEADRLRNGPRAESGQGCLAEIAADFGGETASGTFGEQEGLSGAFTGTGDRNRVASESSHECVAEKQPAVGAGGAGWLFVGALAVAASALVIWLLGG